MTPEEALTRLGESTGDALLDTLRTFCGDAVEHGAPVVIPQGTQPLARSRCPRSPRPSRTWTASPAATSSR